MGCVITGSKYRWKEGIIPYMIDENHFPKGSNERQAIDKAISHWNNHTSISLIPQHGENDYVIFRKGDGCSSKVGRQGGQQTINCDLKDGNFKTGSIIHEIGHAVGLWHEQSREDRDSFIIVNHDNIIDKKKYAHNFEPHVNDGTDIGPYDYGSIMHYRAGSFAKKNTITITAPYGAPKIGQREGLSKGDINTIATIYRASSQPEINVKDYDATVTASGGLNIRSGPSSRDRKIGILPNGHTVKVTHHNGVWRRILWGKGRTGYVYYKYLRKASSIPDDINVTDYNATVTASSGLNIRSGPSSKDRKIGALPNGQIVKVTHHNGGWRRISMSKGRIGYVYYKYLRKT